MRRAILPGLAITAVLGSAACHEAAGPREAALELAFVKAAYGRIGHEVVTSQVFLARADGGGLYQATVLSGAKADLAWSPDGARLAFVLDGSIQILDVASGSVAPPGGAATPGARPAWSPRGDALAYFRWNALADIEEAVVVDVRGGQQRVLGEGRYPAWSPDGTEIAVWRGNPDSLVAMRADGSGERLIGASGHPYSAQAPAAWSPDGLQIAWSRWYYRPDSTNRVQVVVGWAATGAEVAVWDGDCPSWSAGGRRIAFISYAGHLTVSDASGRGPVETPYGITGDSCPRWAPDGTHLAVYFWNGREESLAVFDADHPGHTASVVTMGAVDASWRPRP